MEVIVISEYFSSIISADFLMHSLKNYSSKISIDKKYV